LNAIVKDLTVNNNLKVMNKTDLHNGLTIDGGGAIINGQFVLQGNTIINQTGGATTSIGNTGNGGNINIKTKKTDDSENPGNTIFLEGGSLVLNMDNLADLDSGQSIKVVGINTTNNTLMMPLVAHSPFFYADIGYAGKGFQTQYFLEQPLALCAINIGYQNETDLPTIYTVTIGNQTQALLSNSSVGLNVDVLESTMKVADSFCINTSGQGTLTIGNTDEGGNIEISVKKSNESQFEGNSIILQGGLLYLNGATYINNQGEGFETNIGSDASVNKILGSTYINISGSKSTVIGSDDSLTLIDGPLAVIGEAAINATGGATTSIGNTDNGGNINIKTKKMDDSENPGNTIFLEGGSLSLTGTTNINTTGTLSTTIGNSSAGNIQIASNGDIALTSESVGITGYTTITGTTDINTTGTLSTTIGNSNAGNIQIISGGNITVNSPSRTTIGGEITTLEGGILNLNGTIYINTRRIKSNKYRIFRIS
jgi:hypothetical protein